MGQLGTVLTTSSIQQSNQASSPKASSDVQLSRPRSRSQSRLRPKLLKVPIPPSLQHSPLLFSSESIFRQEDSGPHPPSKEDEVWLQDTIPLAASAKIDAPEEAVASADETPSATVVETGGRTEDNLMCWSTQAHGRPSKPSPPLVRRLSTPSSSGSKTARQSRTSSIIVSSDASHSYFVMTYDYDTATAL
jgi:hypothetical protein